MITYLLKYVTKLLANLDVTGDAKFNYSDIDVVLKWVQDHAALTISGLQKAASIAALFNDKWPGRAQWIVDGIVKFAYILAKVQKLLV